jgi:MFS family permease
MSRKALIALGIGQCVNWGVLYYAFGVLVLPLERELGVPTWVVTGAFSAALLTSAAAAPLVGRWSDQGRGATVMQAGGVIATTLLTGWTLAPGVFMLYVVWAALGLCMATTLYEPAFNIIGREFHEPPKRLRALAAVTIFGGLASTVFLPLTALLLEALGWRGTVLVLAGFVAASAGLVRTVVFRELSATSVETAFEVRERREPEAAIRPARFNFLAAAFALTTLASAAFAANLVPVLGDRHLPPRTAAMLGGLMGLMQLPGRALVMNRAFSPSPWTLLTTSLSLLAGGLAAVAVVPSTAAVVAGTMLFGLGAGLMTLVRPHLIQTVFRTGIGHVNGRIARQQQLARAVGPLSVAWAAGHVGYAWVFAVMGAAFAFVALLSAACVGTTQASRIGQEVS